MIGKKLYLKATKFTKTALPNIGKKAFLYSGIYDAQCPHEFTEEAAHLMPNATMTTFYESNHSPVVEEEEAFHQFVKQSLEQVLI